MIQTDDLSRAVDALTTASRVAVLTGAGVSKESGIPTFREAQTGLWSRYDPQQLATPDAFRRDPDLVWSWYKYRSGMVAAASPNPGHMAVAELDGLVEQVVVLTQNVDGLHGRAGSKDVVELHGSLQRYKCSAGCQGEPTIVDITHIPHDDRHAPPCPFCSALVRPDIVWFGEILPAAALDRAVSIARQCDVMLVVGTSGLVQPAASLPALTWHSGGTVIEVGPEETQITPMAHIFLRGPSGEVLPQLVGALRLRSLAARTSEQVTKKAGP